MTAGAISLVALAVVLGSLGWLHRAPTRLSPVRDPVSQYGISAYRGGYRVATIAFAAAGLALAVGIDQTPGISRSGAVVALLVVFAVARAAISWFPMDGPGATRTATGRIHWLLALAAFGSATAAAFRLAGSLRGGARWHSLAPTSRALAWAMLACLIVMAVSRSLPSVRARFGAVERGFYLCAIAWFAVFAAACAAGAA
ncbi:MAG: DUF998 domain-containing protein [Solirubrobacteraceae bacterium]